MWWIKKTPCSAFLTALVMLVWVPVGCDNTNGRTYRVGVINIVPALDQSLAGFKRGMEELGYTEGENIRYIYNGPTTEMGRISEEAHSLVADGVDLILTMTTPATLAVKQATAGSEIPVVFAVVTDPVGAGIVNSMRQPGGNITGVAFGIAEARRMEWLVRIAPEIRKIYVPYNPKDKSPVLALKIVRNVAEKLGIQLITRKVQDAETVSAAILNIPEEADAVFLLPDSLMSTRMPELLIEATKLKIPMSVPNVDNVKADLGLTCFGMDLYLTGKEAARLVDLIFKGARPDDLPVEMAEFYLAINLKLAKAINLTITDDILRHAHIIVR